ncbi:hypothetical protein BC829DRAFT_388920, partial [Chytridium lagenaria]
RAVMMLTARTLVSMPGAKREAATAHPKASCSSCGRCLKFPLMRSLARRICAYELSSLADSVTQCV